MASNSAGFWPTARQCWSKGQGFFKSYFSLQWSSPNMCTPLVASYKTRGMSMGGDTYYSCMYVQKLNGRNLLAWKDPADLQLLWDLGVCADSRVLWRPHTITGISKLVVSILFNYPFGERCMYQLANYTDQCEIWYLKFSCLLPNSSETAGPIIMIFCVHIG